MGRPSRGGNDGLPTRSDRHGRHRRNRAGDSPGPRRKSLEIAVVNKSETAAIEFRTQEDGEWSSNWIKDRIEPGDSFDMDFGTDSGDCEVRTEIRFTDGSYFDADVDYCKVSTLYIHETKLTSD
jgi:hypothetical protein